MVTTGSKNPVLAVVLALSLLGAGCALTASSPVKPATSPSITTQPANQSVVVGQKATYSVAATGTAPLSYQWQKNGASISGATLSSYTTPPTTLADNGASFVAVVSDSNGSTKSSPAILTVDSAPVAPSITTQPGSQSVTAGQTATFSVAATGTAPLSYQWQKNGVNVGTNSSSYTTAAATTSDNGASFTVTITNSAGNIKSAAAILTVNATPVAPSITTQPGSQSVTAGQTATFSVAATGTAPLSYQWQKNGVNVGTNSSSYTTAAATTSDNGASFTVTITNSAGNIKSAAAILTVNATPVAPSITTQPGSQSVTAGQTATFSVAATGTAPLSYQWQKNGVNVGTNSSSYTTAAATTSDNGASFTVTITNSAGNTKSAAAILTVNATPVAPSITTQPGSQSVTAGQTATFSVAATGTAPLSYQWQKNGVNVGTNSSSYTTAAATTSDNGASFTVTITNSAGNIKSAAAILTVNATPVAPSITTQPGSQSVTAGQTATFSVAATGTAPLSYQWQKNGVNVGTNSSSYTAAATTSDNGASFTVTITNSAGNTKSAAAILTVNAAPVAPSITTQPGSQSVTAGQTAAFSVAATGTAPLSYQWQKNGVNVGTNSSSYTAAATTSDNGASFTVTITNSAGNTKSAAAILTVNAAPVAPSITTQPGSQSVTAGQTATFSVAATGTAPLSYQWQKNGVNVGTNSSSYTTAAATTSDNGASFTVTITNSAGNIKSAAAILTVNAAPVTYTISGSISGAGGNGATVTLSGAASASTTANSSGNYTFSGLANGTYAVTPAQTGYTFSPSSQAATINGANVTGVNFTATSVGTTYTISGTISPSAGGSGATVTLSGAAGATTTANSSGVYSFTALGNGSYTVTPSNSGYSYTPTNQAVTINGASVSGVNFTASASATVIFYDDFQTDTELSSQWFALDVYSDVNSEAECYKPSQVAIVPGTGLVETAIVQSVSCNGHTLPYTSGAIVMAPPFTFLYGTVEFKAKVAGCTGCWPAIWMLGHLCQPSAPTIYNANTCDWPNPGADEIDITELLDSNFTSVNQQIHTAGSNAGGRAATTDTSKNFHVYDLVWSPGTLVWKIDGVITQTVTNSFVPSHPMYLIINLAMGGSGGGGVNNSTLPSSTVVEYVKVTQP